jgi:hypothetical protein
LDGITSQQTLPAIVYRVVDHNSNIVGPQRESHLIRFIFYDPSVHGRCPNVIIGADVPVPSIVINVTAPLFSFTRIGGAQLLIHQTLLRINFIGKQDNV